jgi:hypothetical protein
VGLGQVADALGGAAGQSDRISFSRFFTRCWDSEGVVSRKRAERLERTSGETESYGDGDNGKGSVNGSPTALKLREFGESGLGQRRMGTRSREHAKRIKSSSTRCTPRQGGLV